MPTPTETELTRFRRKIGDTAGSLSQPLLEDLWDEANGDEATAVANAIWMLLTDATRFADYTVGQTSEKKQQIFENLRTLWMDYRVEMRLTGHQPRIVGMRAVPPVWKDVPIGEEHPDEKNRRHTGAYPYRRRGRSYGEY